jgi:hypothetical protein
VLGTYVFASAESDTMNIREDDSDRWKKIKSLEQWDSLTENLGKDSTIMAGFIYREHSHLLDELYELANDDKWNTHSNGKPALVLHSDDKGLAEEIGCDTKGRESFCFVVAKTSVNGKAIRIQHRNENDSDEHYESGKTPRWDAHIMHIPGSDTPKPALLKWIEAAANMAVKSHMGEGLDTGEGQNDDEIGEDGNIIVKEN